MTALHYGTFPAGGLRQLASWIVRLNFRETRQPHRNETGAVVFSRTARVLREKDQDISGQRPCELAGFDFDSTIVRLGGGGLV